VGLHDRRCARGDCGDRVGSCHAQATGGGGCATRRLRGGGGAVVIDARQWLAYLLGTGQR
jgi:hypothetical protein